MDPLNTVFRGIKTFCHVMTLAVSTLLNSYYTHSFSYSVSIHSINEPVLTAEMIMPEITQLAMDFWVLVWQIWSLEMITAIHTTRKKAK